MMSAMAKSLQAAAAVPHEPVAVLLIERRVRRYCSWKSCTSGTPGRVAARRRPAQRTSPAWRQRPDRAQRLDPKCAASSSWPRLAATRPRSTRATARRRLARRRAGGLSLGVERGVPGVQPPGDTGHSGRPGPAVQMEQGCRDVKRDGTAGLVGCWIKRRRRRHRTAGEFGRLP
jgi:hypothetical protein